MKVSKNTVLNIKMEHFRSTIRCLVLMEVRGRANAHSPLTGKVGKIKHAPLKYKKTRLAVEKKGQPRLAQAK